MLKQINNQDRVYEYDESEHLGSGAFATVYKGKIVQKAKGQKCEIEVAIKVINRGKLKRYGDEIINTIGDEVNILHKLSLLSLKDPCPNIVKIYDCFETTNNYYIILEYCNGGSLLDQMKKTKAIPEQQAIPIFHQVVSAVNYIAKHEIVHRDIKPDNIFIHNGVYKLGDFGFASQKSLFNTTLGTYPYMAPEFFKDPSYDKQVDIWAIGIMYHEMLFNELYFMGQSQFEVSERICKVPYKILQKHLISPQSQDVLLRCIEKDRQKRITASQLFNHPLFEPLVSQLQQQQQQQQMVAEDSSQIEAIGKQIMNARNGLVFLVQLGEKLDTEWQDKSRFDIFYLMRKCLNGLSGLYQCLQNRVAPGFIGAIGGTNAWKAFVEASTYSNYGSILEQDLVFILNKFYQYAAFLELFIKQHFPQNIYQQMQTIINSNPEQIIPPQLYQSQIKNLFDFFSNKVAISKSIDDILMASKLAIAFKIDSCIEKQIIDFEKFEIESKNYQGHQIIEIINAVISS